MPTVATRNDPSGALPLAPNPLITASLHHPANCQH